MSRRVRNWCDICRDTEPELRCAEEGCNKQFHRACLANVGAWNSTDDPNNYICEDCREAQYNDATCYICKKELVCGRNSRRKRKAAAPKVATPAGSATEEDEDNISESTDRPKRQTRSATIRESSPASEKDRHGGGKLSKQDISGSDVDFALCDGCTNSVHLKCLGVESLPADELWFCPDCDPHSATATKLEAEKRQKAEQQRQEGKERGALGNVDICYVCQKGGKLLGCDFCEQSFHPRCIDAEFLEFETDGEDDEAPDDRKLLAQKWRCPICKGQDPLQSMTHKRMSRTAMLKLSSEWQECIQKTHRTCRQNRDRFLWSCRDALTPFVSEKTLAKLRKASDANKKKKMKVRLRSDLKKKKGVRRRGNMVSDSDSAGTESDSSASTSISGLSAQGMLSAEEEGMRCYNRVEMEALAKNERILGEGVRLKGYQKCGVGWLLNGFIKKAGAILADEMGLGKTIQCLGFLSCLKLCGYYGPNLVIVPLSTVGNWLREIRRFVPHLKYIKICGNRIERDHLMYSDKLSAQGLYDIYLTTYETLIFEESYFCDYFKFQSLILDEAHRIKNESGRIRNSLDRISANMRVLLTGTPLQNSIKELFTLLNFLFPDVLNDSQTFDQIMRGQDLNESTNRRNNRTEIDDASNKERTVDGLPSSRKGKNNDYSDKSGSGDKSKGKNSKTQPEEVVEGKRRGRKPIQAASMVGSSPEESAGHNDRTQKKDGQNKDFEYIDEAGVSKLSSLLGKMMLRRTKDLVVRLPKKIEHDIWVPLSPSSAYWYRKLLDVSEKAFQQRSVKKLLGAVVKMRICCCHPRGLISRDVQFKRFHEIFSALEEEEISSYESGLTAQKPSYRTEIEVSANKLKSLDGEHHILASSKLIVLDKLLTHFHLQNLEVSEPYKADYIQSLKNHFVQEADAQQAAAEKSKQLEPPKPPKPRKKKIERETVRAKDDLSIPETAESGEGSSVHDSSIKSAPPNISPTPGSPPEAARKNAARKVAEKIRKEKAAALAAQQAEQEANILRSVEERMNSLTDAARDPQLFWEYMVPADIEEEEDLDPAQPAKPDDPNMDDNATEDCKSNDGASVHSETFETPQGATQRDSVMIEISQDQASDHPARNLSEHSNNQTNIETHPPISKPLRKPAKPLPHKVLVFTQFQLVLDELERFCQFRGFRYLRLDGSTNKMIRELDIREFNNPSSTHLVYLICTRAGGVGINLVTANHVVMYDEDWNPFIDLQAIDRAHRIGQKRDVHVWKLITEWTVEERMAFRRLQKLKLDRLLIQANTVQEAGEEEGPGASLVADEAEKFSIEEIRRLIRHGRSAIRKVGLNNDNIADRSIEDILARERRPLPDVEEEEAIGDDEVEGGEEVSLRACIEQEEAAGSSSLPFGPSAEARTVSSATEGESHIDDGMGEIGTVDDAPTPSLPDEPSKGADEGEDIDASRRSRRLRKRLPMQSALQAAELWMGQKARQERKIIHDKKCFKCALGVNVADGDSDILCPCHRCPRVYHLRGCLLMEEPPKKTWTCPWHECCLCFRKGSQAGGLLIHCAECPTTFCFDCFPPEYRRHNPPASYFGDLAKRGYHVTPEKLILFLCSRCKALKEQQRRRMLSRQQLEAELKKRREAQLKARADANKLKGDQAGGPQSSMSKKEFASRKKQIDDVEKGIGKSIREEYERLFPNEFVALLKERKAVQLSQQQTKKAETQPAAAPGGPQPQSTADVKEEPQDGPPAKKAAAAGGTKIFLVKLPSEFCKLCDNCHLPGHELPSCPFPPEAEKKSVPAGTKEESGAPEAPAPTGAAATGPRRLLMRSFCPKCGVSSRNHLRRHCDRLEPQEIDEYAKRKELVSAFLQRLKECAPVSVPDGLSTAMGNMDVLRRALQRLVDEKIDACLVESGLAICVARPAAPQRTGLRGYGAAASAAAGSGGHRRKRKADDSAEDSPMDEDQTSEEDVAEDNFVVAVDPTGVAHVVSPPSHPPSVEGRRHPRRPQKSRITLRDVEEALRSASEDELMETTDPDAERSRQKMTPASPKNSAPAHGMQPSQARPVQRRLSVDPQEGVTTDPTGPEPPRKKAKATKVKPLQQWAPKSAPIISHLGMPTLAQQTLLAQSQNRLPPSRWHHGQPPMTAMLGPHGPPPIMNPAALMGSHAAAAAFAAHNAQWPPQPFPMHPGYPHTMMAPPSSLMNAAMWWRRPG